MSAVARPVHRPIEEESLVSSAHVHDLIAEKSKLERDLRSANAARDNLFRQLNYAVAASKVEHALVVDGMATVITSTGVVRQLQTVKHESSSATEYVHEWVELPAVPGTAAAFRDKPRGNVALDMDCTDGDEEAQSA